MDRVRAKRVAAAVSAVLQYEREGESPQPRPAEAPSAFAETGMRVWGLAGRQESMALRSLWQRRVPKAW